LEDLEREKRWDSGFGPNNPGAERRKLNDHYRRLREIEDYLKDTGVIEKTEKEKLNEQLDTLYPSARSKSIEEYNGKKYRCRYFPIETSKSGKTVHEWGHIWELVE
jgi:primosomal protein N''